MSDAPGAGERDGFEEYVAGRVSSKPGNGVVWVEQSGLSGVQRTEEATSIVEIGDPTPEKVVIPMPQAVETVGAEAAKRVVVVV